MRRLIIAAIAFAIVVGTVIGADAAGYYLRTPIAHKTEAPDLCKGRKPGDWPCPVKVPPVKLTLK